MTFPPSFDVEWTDLCPTGIQVFLPGTYYLAPCFQQLVVQLPIVVMIAVVSAFRVGRQTTHGTIIHQTPAQSFRVRLVYISRLVAVFGLAVIPLIRLTVQVMSSTNPVTQLWPIDILDAGVRVVAFLSHFVFLLSKGSHISKAWIILIVALLLPNGVQLYQQHPSAEWILALVDFALLLFYGVTLVVGSAVAPVEREEDDTQSLVTDSPDAQSLGPAQDSANFLSRFTFFWVNSLIDKGVAGRLNQVDDLFQLPASIQVVQLAQRMREAIAAAPTLFWALHKAHGVEFYSIGLLRFVSDVAGFAGPLLLGGLLSHTTADAQDAGSTFDGAPYWYAFGLFATTMISALSATHFGWRVALLNTKLQVSLVTAIYRKSLEARSLDEAKPEIMNLMSTDAERVLGASYCFHSLWSIPFQLGISLYLLYTQIGLAFAAGLVFVLAMFPINQWMVGRLNHFATQMMEQKDKRVALCSEALSSAKSIKLNAWEEVFIGKIMGIRREEMRQQAKVKYFDAVVIYVWAVTPVVMSVLTFGTSVLTGHRMTAVTTFTSVALLNMLMEPLNSLPWVINGLSEAWVSLKRIQELINLPAIDLMAYYEQSLPLVDHQSPQIDEEPPVVLNITNALFAFENPRSREGLDESNSGCVVDFKLDNVNVTVRKGELLCLKGPLGGGKTTFLSAILAKLRLENGQIYVEDPDQGFGYVAQSPWLQRGTIRENIVWGAPFRETFYQQVLHSCALLDDIQALGGDQSGVGEGGQTLSGGQRARLALARAVYQDKEVYLLDDILSALDAHVATHIVRHCVLGILRHKTRIIVTEHKRLLAIADQVLSVENGTVTGGTSRDVGPDEDLATDEECVSDHEQQKRPTEMDAKEASILDEETREYGTLSWDVFQMFGSAAGVGLSVTTIVLVVLQKASSNLGDLWLAHWVADAPNAPPERRLVWGNSTTANDDIFNLWVFAGLAGVNSLVTIVMVILFAYGCLKAARSIHERLLRRVFATQFQFFDVTPLGRLLNRFSSDTYSIDDTLPFMLGMLFSQSAALVATMIITVFALPWLILLVVPLVPVYFRLQNRYRFSSRDIKRLSSNAMSPIYAHFTETLQGLTTIRAMTATERFDRDFRGKLNDSIRAQLSAHAAEQWLVIRLQMMGALMVLGCGLVAAVTGSHASNPGLVGLAISYALSITGLLEGVLYSVTQTEQEMIAVERVNKYCQLPLEEDSDASLGDVRTPTDWPGEGEIVFTKASLKYRPNLRASLNQVNLLVEKGQRVGVAGRTGAGKSSLLSALFRVVPLCEGTISIDSRDIASIPVSVLRDRLALVPQQPFLFSGTVRENLDPREEYADSRIWEVIDSCLAKPLVQSLGGLPGRIESQGKNLSAGQKQLLCLARALLKSSKVVCIDEGTANLDADSERDIQLVLRQAFTASTVLLIAHRVTSLQNTDRVIVMQDGRVLEDGPTEEMSLKEGSLFYAMLNDQRKTSDEPANGAVTKDDDCSVEPLINVNTTDT